MNKKETLALDIYQEILAKKHFAKNIRKLNDLVDEEDPFAYYVVGKIYLVGIKDIPANKRKAKKYLNKAYPKLVALSNRGNEKAETIINSYDNLLEDTKKEKESSKEKKNAETLPQALVVARALEGIEDPVKYLLENKKLDKAIKILNSEMNKNNGYAFFIAAAVKRYGIKDVSTSLSQSNKLFAKAFKILSDYEDKLAYRMLACIYRDGFGKVAIDNDKSLELFAKASSLGDVKSSVYLAQYYEKSEHIDIAKSNVFWDIATSQGSTKAVQSLNDEKKDYDHKDITIYPIEDLIKKNSKKAKKENKDDSFIKEIEENEETDSISEIKTDENKIEKVDYDVPEANDLQETDMLEQNHSFVGAVFSKEQKLDIKDLKEDNSSLKVEEQNSQKEEISETQKEDQVEEQKVEDKVDSNSLVHEEAEDNYELLKQEVQITENADDKKANVLLLNGIHMLKDENSESKSDSIKIFKEAAKLGSVRALVVLGYLYEKGYIVNQSNKLASDYYMLAIERGSINAKYRYGLILLGEGKEIGLYNIRDAAKDGLPQALNKMGDFYINGKFGLKDIEKAYSFYKLAAERGYALSYYNMSEIDKNYNRLDIADENYKNACNLGYKKENELQEVLL